MQPHARLRASHWVLLVLALAVLAHGAILRYASSRLTLPAVALASVVVLLVIWHLGLVGALRGFLRRRSRRRP